MKLDSVAKDVADSRDFWLQQHEVSFPELLKRTIADVFSKWLEEHLTEIIESIAKHLGFTTMPEYQPKLVTGGVRGAVLLNKPHHHFSLTERKRVLGFALDRSGSMSPLAGLALQSLNQLVDHQLHQQNAARVDLPRAFILRDPSGSLPP